MILFYRYYVCAFFVCEEAYFEIDKACIWKNTEASSLSILLLHEPLLKHDDNVKAA